MNALELHNFSMRLVKDSFQEIHGALRRYDEAPAHDLNRIRDLWTARAWVKAAKTNLKIAERELNAAAKGSRP